MKRKVITTLLLLFFGSAAVVGSWQASKPIGALLAVALLAVLFFMWRPKKSAPAPVKPETDSALDVSCFPYSYTNVGLYRPDGEALAPIPPVGSAVLLELDPENAYDAEAVRATRYTGQDLLRESPVVGYLNRGKLRDMVGDFLRRGDTVVAVVSQTEPRLEINIGMSRSN